MSPVEQAVGPVPYFWLQLSGYLLFAAAWIVISLAIMRGMLDARAEISRALQSRRRRPRQMPIPFPVIRARVIAFPTGRRPKKVTPYA
jgi:hypothetical protein